MLAHVLEPSPDKTTEALGHQIEQLSRDLERLTAEWVVLSRRLWPLVELAEKLGKRWLR